MDMPDEVDERFVEVSTVDELGPATYRFERSFFRSNWECIWGRGCLGIHDHPTPELQQGCCSVGAELADEHEAMQLSALAATVPAEVFQFHAEAADGFLAAGGPPYNTRVVDGACIFLNRPGFAGGAGCALHLAAVRLGESPIEWKPSVCWQLPVHVDWEDRPDGSQVATVRRWTRDDWDEEGRTMTWWCTEGDLAYRGERPVVESLEPELSAMFGTEVVVELRRRL